MLGHSSGRGKWHHQSYRSRQCLRVPRDEGDVIAEIDGAMRRWGIDATNNERHALFADRVKETAVNCFNADVVKGWEPFDTSVMLPSDVNQALTTLLTHNLRQVTKDGSKTAKRETSDAINEKYGVFMPFPPFNCVRGEMRLSRAYSELNPTDDELDPLMRFSYKDRDVRDFMMEQFGQEPGDDYPSHFIRALVLYEAVAFQSCFGCKGNLRWNSSLRSDFCNLICSGCNSVYALCCVADSKKVSVVFEKKSFFRGSYAHFHQLLQSKMEDGFNHNSGNSTFILFATRSRQDHDARGGVPVYVARIKGAAPNLNSDSFSLNRIHINSNLLIEPLNNQDPWFKIEIPKEIDVLGLSMKVFHSYFEPLNEKGCVPENEEANEASETGLDRTTGQISNLEKILAQIRGIKKKQHRGVALEKWEIGLVQRENKVLLKLEEYQTARG